jgi:hypothetical protein
MNYHFSTNEFGISDQGIHFLRSGYNYETIKFSKIDSIRIEKGMEHHNWIVIFIIGALLFSAGLYTSGSLLDAILEENVSGKSAKGWFAFAMIAMLGFWFVSNSVRSGTILWIQYDGKRLKFPLREIVQQKELSSFIEFLSQKMENRLRVKMSKAKTLVVKN